MIDNLRLSCLIDRMSQNWLVDRLTEADQLTNQLISWLTKRLAAWLTGWLTDYLTDWFIDCNWWTDWWCINWLVTNFSIGWMIYCVLTCLLTFSFDGWIDRLIWLMFDRFKTLEFGRFDEIVVSWIWCIKNVSLPCYFLPIKLSSPWLLLFHLIFSAGCGIPSR